ncbi:MAG: hypothetical protein JWN79_3276 [Gemmatimonadetes bacterium]|nr:hypothetical protein [Gemmatimonadota bacterium]
MLPSAGHGLSSVKDNQVLHPFWSAPSIRTHGSFPTREGLNLVLGKSFNLVLGNSFNTEDAEELQQPRRDAEAATSSVLAKQVHVKCRAGVFWECAKHSFTWRTPQKRYALQVRLDLSIPSVARPTSASLRGCCSSSASSVLKLLNRRGRRS